MIPPIHNDADVVSLADYDIERLAKAVGVLRHDGLITRRAVAHRGRR